MELQVRYIDSTGCKELKKIDKGLSDKALVLNGDIENECVYIQGGTMKNIKKYIGRDGWIDNRFIVSKSYFDTGMNDSIYGFLHIVIGDCLLRYMPVKRLSIIGQDTEVDYVPVLVYDCSNSDTLKLVRMSGVDDMDEWGLDQEIIDQILSECTEVKV